MLEHALEVCANAANHFSFAFAFGKFDYSIVY